MSHIPVLLKESINIINPQNNHTYIDATFGAGGFSKAILNAADCKVIAIDQDLSTKKYAEEMHKIYRDRFSYHNINFKSIDDVISDNTADGIIFDIGVSNMQIKDPSRGFSFQEEGPLDMRMNNNINSGLTAKKLIDNVDEKSLADIIFRYGDERCSRRIAKAIIKEKYNIFTTTQLASVIHKVLGCEKFNKINTATKTFQALRIYINNELENFNIALEKSIKILKKEGIILAITFHSLEDKIMKNYLKKYTQKKMSFSKYAKNKDIEKQINQENNRYGIIPIYKLINNKPICASHEELKNNPGARSAKLRAAQKIC